MITIRPASERGHANHGWLDTHHSFSFAEYYDPRWMGFRVLRVLNDDRLAPTEGFDMHPHRDMEIISYVVDGALEHKDSLGNGREIRPDDFQYMSAGSGVLHSEFNPSKTEWGRFLQIWITPQSKGLKPCYADRSLAGAETGRWHLVASADGRDGSFAIRQTVDLWFASLEKGAQLGYSTKPGRHQWLQVATGRYELSGKVIAEGDGVAVSEESGFELKTLEAGKLLLFDLP